MNYYRLNIKPILLLFIFLILSTQFSLADTIKSPKIKIGVITDLSSVAVASGNDLKDTLIFANKKLGEDKFELIFEDEKCNAKDAVNASHKLVNFHKVDLVIGFVCSSSILASAPIFEKAKIPVIVASASSPQVAGIGKYIFRLSVNDRDAGKVLGDYLKKVFENENKKIKIGSISALTEYCKDLDGALKDNLSKEKFEYYQEEYLPTESNFKSSLLRLKNNNIEALFVNPQAEPAFATIIKQIKELNWNPKIYSAYWPSGETLLKEMGSQLEGIEYVDTISLKDLLNSTGQNIFEEFKREGGKLRSIEVLFATSYEAFSLVSQAYKAGIPLIEFLKTGTFKGIFGEYKFNEKQEVTNLSFDMKRIKGGKVERM